MHTVELWGHRGVGMRGMQVHTYLKLFGCAKDCAAENICESLLYLMSMTFSSQQILLNSLGYLKDLINPTTWFWAPLSQRTSH